MSMPQPEPQALAHSRELARRIAAGIREAGGWIGFDAWMARALYEPGLGYYSGPARPFGARGDFVTAPELSPLFAACVARQVAQWFDEVPPVVVEFGAGTGRLAADLLAALHALGTPVRRYRIVELSGPLRARQRETIGRLAPQALDAVQWLDALPDRIEGVVIGNEVLDAMPVRVFEHAGGGLEEVGVIAAADDAFEWATRPADATLREAVDGALRAAAAHREAGAAADGGVPAHAAADPFEGLGPGRYRSEVAPQAAAWVATVGRALHRGAMLLLDYGFPAREYYHPQRDTGTLVAHWRHHAHGDVLRWPGLQDVTAHVDFTAVARAGESAGLELLGYTSQARFLLNCGALEHLADATRVHETAAGTDRGRDAVARARALGAAQTLLSEAEMGELFKAIAFGRGVSAPAIGFGRGDRSGTL
jgi:SAM-dependent MidA family methyltransferase